MTDEHKDEKHDGSEFSELPTPIGKVRVSSKTLAMLLPYVGPHLKWIAFAIAFAILAIGLGYGVSMVWTAIPQADR